MMEAISPKELVGRTIEAVEIDAYGAFWILSLDNDDRVRIDVKAVGYMMNESWNCPRLLRETDF